jgi:hypothetical protein
MSRRAITWMLVGTIAVAGMVGLDALRRTGGRVEGSPPGPPANTRAPSEQVRPQASAPTVARRNIVIDTSSVRPANPGNTADGAAIPAKALPPMREANGPAPAKTNPPAPNLGETMRNPGARPSPGGAAIPAANEIGELETGGGSARRNPSARPMAATSGPAHVSARAPDQVARAPGPVSAGRDVTVPGGLEDWKRDASAAPLGENMAPPRADQQADGKTDTRLGPPEAALGNAGDAGTLVEPEPIETPLDVVQVGRRWQDDVMQMSFVVMLDDDAATPTPNGLIVCQQIPEGWEVVESEPAVQAVDRENRIAKWLFMGNTVTNNSIYSLSMRAADGTPGDWTEARAWYTFRQPDGQCREVKVIPYEGN